MTTSVIELSGDGGFRLSELRPLASVGDLTLIVCRDPGVFRSLSDHLRDLEKFSLAQGRRPLPSGMLSSSREIVVRPPLRSAHSAKPLKAVEAQLRKRYPMSSVRVVGQPLGLLETAGERHLIQAEFEHYARSPAGPLLPASKDLHYEAPDGRHYRAYLRASLAIGQLDRAEAIAFWFGGYFASYREMVADRPGTATILRAAGFQWNAAFPSLKWPQVFESRDAWMAAGSSKARLTAPLLYFASVRGSGSSSRAMQREHDLTRIFTLYGGGLPPSEATLGLVDPSPMCVLAELEPPDHLLGCRICQDPERRSPTALVDPATQLLDVPIVDRSGEARRRVRVSADDASDARNFVSKYGHLGAMSVHRDQDDRRRHHAVFVDVSRLIGDPVFQHVLRRSLRPIASHVDLVVHAPHESARRFARLIHDVLGVRILPLDLASDRDSQRVGDTLFVDDVMITGRRWSAGLERLVELGWEAKRIRPMVAVDRRPHHLDPLPGVHPLRALETLILPDWHVSECPWCSEREVLEELDDAPERDQVREHLRRRLERLQMTSDGLTSDLFAQSVEYTDTDLVVPEEEWARHVRSLRAVSGPGLLYAQHSPEALVAEGDPASDVAVFFALASGMQVVRNRSSVERIVERVAEGVLDMDLYLEGEVFPPRFLASLLRSTARQDLRTPSTEARLRELVGRTMIERRELRDEMILAMYRGVLPVVTEAAHSLLGVQRARE
jgi:hypothetical protein